MKYLAIIKDSFREAIDSKVFAVTVALSVVLTVVVGSVSFKPLPAQEAFQDIISRFRNVFPDRGHSLQARPFHVSYEFKDLKQLNETSQPQAGDYHFILSMPEKEFKEAAEYWLISPDSSKLQALTDQTMAEFIKDQFATFGNVQVTHVQSLKNSAANRTAFEIQTKGGKGVRGWLHDPNLFFGAVPLRFLRQSLGFIVYWIEDRLVNTYGAWIGILLGVVITAAFIPNMLRKGTIDLLLVKPIHRVTLLIYKYVGGLTFMFLNSAVAISGMWLVLGLRSGIWSPGFLLSIPILTFFFAILYAVSTLFGVLTRSPIVSILMTCIIWFVLLIIGYAYSALNLIKNDSMLSKELEIPEWVYSGVQTAHFVLPRTSDLDTLTTKLLSQEIMTKDEVHNQRLDLLPTVSWGESLTVSGVFIGLLLGLACWRFARKDF